MCYKYIMKKVLLAAVLFLAGCGAGNKQDTQASLQTGIDEEAHTIVLDEDTYFSTMVMVLAFPDKYEGYEVSIFGSVDRIRYHEEDGFFVGRTVVTCCLEDAEFMGLVCLCDDAADYSHGDWVNVYGTLHSSGNVRELVDTTVMRAEAPKEIYLYPAEN